MQPSQVTPNSKVCEALVGDALEFDASAKLTQKPDGSSVSMVDGTLTIDAAGVFLVSTAEGPWTVYAFPAVVLTHHVRGDNQVNRGHLRELLRLAGGPLELGATNELRAKLEGSNPPALGVQWASYGN
jgi:hypothetical protein